MDAARPLQGSSSRRARKSGHHGGRSRDRFAPSTTATPDAAASKRRVDQVVGEQIHFVDVEDSPGGLRAQQAGFEGVITSQGSTEVDRAE